MPWNTSIKNLLLFCLSVNGTIQKFLHNLELLAKQHNDSYAKKIPIEYYAQEK